MGRIASTLTLFYAISLGLLHFNQASANPRCNHLPESLASADELNNFINACEIKSIDQLIPKLPQSYRDRFALMHESHAEDEVREPGTVTPLLPRAILFGGSGKLVLAFTSNPIKNSFQDLQMLEFNEHERTTQFKTIRFQNNQVLYERNPQTCKGCHGENQNPIWGAYPFWPGAYGSKHDLMSAPEMAHFQDFLKETRSDKQSRFQYLNQSNLNHQYIYREHRDFQANFELTAILSNMVAAKMARIIEDSPNFLSYRNLLFWSAYECAKDHASPASEAAMDKLLSSVETRYSAKTLEIFKKYLKPPSTRDLSINHLFSLIDPEIFSQHLTQNGFSPRYLTGLGYIEETAVNHVAQNAGFEVIDSQNYGLPELLFRLAQANPVSGNVKIKQDKVCQKLSESLDPQVWFAPASARGQNLVRSSVPSLSTETLLSGPFKKCIRCHTGENPVGQAIPFDDASKLKARLKADSSLKTKIVSEIESGRMPYFEAKLSEPEQNEIRNYLMRIAP